MHLRQRDKESTSGNESNIERLSRPPFPWLQVSSRLSAAAAPYLITFGRLLDRRLPVLTRLPVGKPWGKKRRYLLFACDKFNAIYAIVFVFFYSSLQRWHNSACIYKVYKNIRLNTLSMPARKILHTSVRKLSHEQRDFTT